MKENAKRHYFRYFLLAGTLAVLFTPLYMYFSHDVAALNKEWPHKLSSNEIDYIEYVVKPGRPKSWVDFKEISVFARWAIVLSEDWAFFQHEGVDFEQMKVALGEMVSDLRFRGASTITQQMVKNVFLSEDRTITRKLHEIILAHKVEKVLSKERILEVYLNVIEFGPRIYGIREAAQHYFKKRPSALTPKEGAFLAMLLPSPKRYYISYKKKKLTEFARQRLTAILNKMRMGKIITAERYENEKVKRLMWEQD